MSGMVKEAKTAENPNETMQKAKENKNIKTKSKVRKISLIYFCFILPPFNQIILNNQLIIDKTRRTSKNRKGSFIAKEF